MNECARSGSEVTNTYSKIQKSLLTASHTPRVFQESKTLEDVMQHLRSIPFLLSCFQEIKGDSSYYRKWNRTHERAGWGIKKTNVYFKICIYSNWTRAEMQQKKHTHIFRAGHTSKPKRNTPCTNPILLFPPLIIYIMDTSSYSRLELAWPESQSTIEHEQVDAQGWKYRHNKVSTPEGTHAEMCTEKGGDLKHDSNTESHSAYE